MGAKDQDQGTTSWPVTAFFLASVGLGACIVNFPFVYDRFGGVYFATFLQLLLIVLIMGTMITLAHCADVSKASNFQEVVHIMCGKRTQHFAALCILAHCYGTCITYLIVIGDQFDRLFFTLMEETFCSTWYLDRRFIVTATSVLFILPFCYFRKLDFLKYISIFGMFAILYPVFLTIYGFCTRDHTAAEVKVVPDDLLQLAATIPVVCFSYNTNESLVPIYVGMRNRNLREFTKASLLAMLILFFIYGTTGTFGYLTFGRHIAQDIMEQYGGSDPVILVGLGALVIKMITTYPVLLLVGRGAFDDLYAGFFKVKPDALRRKELKRRVIVASLWFVTSVIVAVVTPNIGIIFEIAGCVTSTLLFIFPGLCLIGLSRRNDLKLHPYKRYLQLFVAILMILFGITVIIIGLAQVIFRDLKPGGELSVSYFKCLSEKKDL